MAGSRRFEQLGVASGARVAEVAPLFPQNAPFRETGR